MNLKQMAAERAVEEVRSGMIVGLGTGSTAAYAVEAIGRALRDGRLHDITGVPTSSRIEQTAREAGIPLRSLNEVEHIDLTIDGADEVDPQLNLIKGLGGALLHEKMVAINSRRELIVVDGSKLVKQLGTHAPLPVEVEPFGWKTQLPFLRDLGCEPILRVTSPGTPYLTDSNHYILDCRFPGIPDPYILQAALQSRCGIAGQGLFLGIAAAVIVAEQEGVRILERDQ